MKKSVMKKKAKGFSGGFGKSFANLDEAAGNKGVSFDKAIDSLKNMEKDYSTASTSEPRKLIKKISSITKVTTLKTLDKSSFTWADISTNYLAFVENVYGKLKDSKENEPVRLDWTGLEHLSDAVFGCLVEKTKIPGYNHVLGIVLTGCYQLTDIGVRWMSQCFPKLKEVSLAGCTEVTESGIFNLVMNCPDLKSIDLTATNIMVLPTQIIGKDVDTAGCPLVSPNDAFIQKNGLNAMKEANYKKPASKNLIKVCIVRQQNFTSNFMPQITGEKIMKKQDLLYKSSVQLKNADIVANIIESEEGMMDKFVSKRSVIVVPYEHDEAKPLDDLVTWLFSVYCQVLTKVSKTSVLFVALVEDINKTVKHHTAAFDHATQMAVEKLTKQKKLLLEKKGSQESPLTKLDQDNMASTMELLNALKTQAPNIKFITAFKDNVQINNSLIQEILLASENVIKLYPEYEELSSHIFQYALSDTCLKMFESDDMTGALSLEGAAPSSAATMELLHLMGKLLYVKSVEESPVVMDIHWLSKVLELIDPQPNAGKFPYVSEKTKTVLLDDLVKKVVEGKLGEKNMTALLPKLGFGFATKYAYVPYRFLDSEPPVSMEEYIGKEADVQEVRYQFNLVHGLATDIMSQLFTYTSFIRKPILMWKNGVVIQENLAQTVIQLKNSRDTPHLELLVQTSSTDTGSLKDTLPRILIHTAKKFKIVIEYILCSHRVPFEVVLKEKLTAKPTDEISGIVIGHKVHTKETGATLCRYCGTATKQTNFLLELRKSLYRKDTIYTIDQKDKNYKETEDDNKGLNIIALGKDLGNIEKGAGIIVKALLEPFEQPEISFTALELDSAEDVKIELRNGTYDLSYSLKTGQLTHGGKSQTLYGNDHLGKTVRISVSPVFQQEAIFYNVKFTVNKEAQVQVTVPAKTYKPYIVPANEIKPEDMKSVIMVHGHSIRGHKKFEITAGMRVEALDRKTPSLICIATVEKVYEDGKLLIHFDGWTSTYDYVCEPTTVDIHPVGWFEANRGQEFMSKFNANLQKPKGYMELFSWDTYCKVTDSLPVPFDFFTDEQKNLCTSDLTDMIYEQFGYSGVETSGNKDVIYCSEKNLPGSYIEYRLLSYPDQLSEELVGFYSNHRQFLCLLPEEFDVTRLRFPSLISVMNIQKQKVHFVCPGHRMELLHLVNHGGLPLNDYLVASSDIDVQRLYAYLEMIYMGLLVQPGVLPWELQKLCPGIDSSSAEKLELLEMGFKRIFFQYLLWIHAYNTSSTAVANKATKTERSTILPAKILKDEKSVTSLSTAFHIMGSSSIIKCQGHAQSVQPQSDLRQIDSKQFKSYAQFMHKFEFQNNGIEKLPEDFFSMFNNLSELNLSENKITFLPEGFTCLTSLEILDISNNLLRSLPKDFPAVKDSLESLNISSNPFGCLPAEIFYLENLQVLTANNLGKVSLKGIGKLTALEKLYLASNMIENIPDEFGSLHLTDLDLSGVPWFPEFVDQKIQPNLSTFKSALYSIIVTRGMTEEEVSTLFAKVDKDANGILDKNEITEVNKIIFEMYPRFGKKKLYYQETAIPPVIWQMKTLKALYIRFHGISVVPDSVRELTALEVLDVSHNPALITLSGQLGGLPLNELHLKDCASLRTPPKEIVDRGFSVVYGYLRRLQQGSVECKRTKLMVVGLGGAGKTSLIRALTNERYATYYDYGDKITDGIDITTWHVNLAPEQPDKPQSRISYSVWDFAGQTVYYNTHQFFLSNRACYLLLWNIRLGYEHAGLDFWLNSIACHAPKAPILVVGTHCDKVEKSRIPTKELTATYPQIAGFHFVSSYSGEGIAHLLEKLVEVTLQQKYMGESIPEAWLSLEECVLQRREKDDLIPFQEVKGMGNKIGIIDEPELIQAVQFLHDLGSLQFFNTEFLRSLVVIRPQWIVDVMACVVTVHVGPIQEGKLLHKDMAVVWAKYPKELHAWLLRLTEEFDLTFPLADEEANLVPCLLPDTERTINWPSLVEDSGVKETKAIYNFKYLPAGLFNRAQVRLQQFSESGQLWKKGMFLKKNNHIAVIKQIGHTILEVKAQGFRPENILFLVDEVISTLIIESYSGVNYDLLVPCIECQNLGMVDPSMFPSSKIHRAVELNAPFLQCDKMFHVLSIPELKSLLPPNKTTEFDDHLRRSVLELKDLGEDVNISVVFCYSKLNVPDLSQENKLVHPGKILEDLRKDGFNVSICDTPETADIESLTIAFKSAQVILFGVSDEFCAEETCRKLLIYAKETLNRPIQLVVLGSSLKFLETSIGLNIGDEVFVKMTEASRYEAKIIELKEALKKKKSKGVADDSPSCFISYCWSNSQDAISKGSPKIQGALGFGDPRKIAEKLLEQKISCWLDIQRVGNSGLFDDIADGLRKAKVMVACVSDEYSASKNCKMEFRFAVAQLKIPTILAVVGTGYEWERSEIGMLAVGAKCSKINFQMNNEAGYLQLFQEIQKYVKSNDEKTGKEATEERKKNAFVEILESAERQFLRNLIKFKEKSFTADYPRLVVIDLIDKEKQKKEKEEKKAEEENKNEHPSRSEQETSPQGREAKYCFTHLCESEEGWHDVPQSIPLPEMANNEDEETYLSKAAPYAARINSILKYSGLQMAVLTTPAGKQLQDKLELHASSVTSEDEVEKAYISIIKDVTGLDVNHTYGGLKKTSLLNGKTLWLCDAHREKVGSITEQRYRTQLKPTQLEEEKPQIQREKTQVEVIETPIASSAVPPPMAQKVPEQPKSQVFTSRNSKTKMKRETSQACSVM